MTNPTSNFGWQMPTPTDLVTDLPADFEVFGQAVDTDFADLLGGTTGQILSKASATDLDFTWITNDVGDITNVAVTSPITGGGSSGSVTIGVSAASTSASGVVQLSDSTSTTSSVLASTPTATKSAYDLAASAYAPAFTNNLYGAKNKIINGDFSIWQRGTSIAVTGTPYTADRFQCSRTGSVAGLTVSRQATNDTTNLAFIQYCARLQRDSGNTSTAAISIRETLETANSIPFAGKSVTISFYARAGANYSPTSNALVAQVKSGTGTDQNSLTGFTGEVNVINQTATLTTTWQRFSYTGTVGSTATQLALVFVSIPTGTAGVNDYFEITGLQLEAGSTATPFQTASGSIGGELALCQRYYWRTTPGISAGLLASGSALTTTDLRFAVKTPVTMRVIPTAIDTSAVATINFADGVNAEITSTGVVLIASTSSQDLVQVYATAASGLTAFRPYYLKANASTTAFIGLTAEL